ncbi:response regulator transcription factor [Streptomyces sp. NPDC004647]|uniref:response regulator transcription factor n=1 Tax=Streptomyces sp. NPDC004647 TaxID=3154671 RepID=UPI0033ABF6A3
MGGKDADGVSRQTSGLRVFVVHPHEMIRRGLAAMMDELGSVARVDDFGDPDAARRRLESARVDVIVFPCAGDDTMRRLAAAGHERRTAAGHERRTRTLCLLEGTDEPHFAVASEISADGFLLTTDLTVVSLEDALTRLVRGEMPLPATLAQWMFRRLRSRAPQRPSRPYLLTPREHQTLCLLAQGMSNKQIAKSLEISEHGAKRHVANVIAKLNCPNRTLAVALALREGIIDETHRAGIGS